jgi:hypothetical protein
MNIRAKLALAASLFLAAGAQAQIVPYLTSVTPNGNGTYTYDYTVNVEAGTTVNFNSYFTIYDLYGLQSVATPSGLWTDSTQNTGVTPPSWSPTDSSSAPNVTWTYTGGPSISGQSYLGEFDIVSTQGSATPATYPGAGDYSYSALESDNGESETGVSFVSTPVAPEPAALGIGAVALMGLRRRK